MRTYEEMNTLGTIFDRYEYAKIGGKVGDDTFGWDRYLNQTLYRSSEWRSLRNQIILRDDGCELGLAGFPIGGRVIIHHLNPITKRDIVERNPIIFDPDNLVCVSHMMHEAIHYGSGIDFLAGPVERRPGDTTLW